MRRYHVTTFGCQMNAHDSERIRGILEELGLGEAHTQAEADVIVFNTCTIREKPDQRLAAQHVAVGAQHCAHGFRGVGIVFDDDNALRMRFARSEEQLGAVARTAADAISWTVAIPTRATSSWRSRRPSSQPKVSPTSPHSAWPQRPYQPWAPQSWPHQPWTHQP